MADDFVGMGGGSGEPPKKHDAKSPVRRDSSISLDDPIPLAEQSPRSFLRDEKMLPYGQGRYEPAKSPLMPLDPQELQDRDTPPAPDSDVESPPVGSTGSSTGSSQFPVHNQMQQFLDYQDKHEKRWIGLDIEWNRLSLSRLSHETNRGGVEPSARTPRATTPVGPSNRIVDSPERDLDMESPITAKKGDYGASRTARSYFTDDLPAGTGSKQSSGDWSMADAASESDDERRAR